MLFEGTRSRVLSKMLTAIELPTATTTNTVYPIPTRGEPTVKRHGESRFE